MLATRHESLISNETCISKNACMQVAENIPNVCITILTMLFFVTKCRAHFTKWECFWNILLLTLISRAKSDEC